MPGQHAPYYVKKRKNKYVVVNKDGEVKGTHDTRQEALDQQAALYVNVPGAKEEADKKHKKSSSFEASSVPCPTCSAEWHPSSFRCAGCDTDFGDLPELLQNKMRFQATRGW